MDIGKYIGKFLIKNNYCSLPGLGVFKLKKVAGSILKSEGTVTPPTHQISFTPVGSIDDSFASFIANFENVSISNASNNIREYCIKVKEELNHTGSFEIDHLGKFSFINQKIAFQQSADLDLGHQPVGIPTLDQKVSVPETKTEKGDKLDFSYPPAQASYHGKSSSASKYIIGGVLLTLLLAGAYFGYDYYKNNATTSEEINPTPASTNVNAVSDTSQVNNSTDSSSMRPASDTSTIVTNNAPIATPSPGAHQVAVFTFTTEAAATAKAAKLKNYGNNASVSKVDSAKLIVAIEASQPQGDTTRLVDSLRKFFNPKGNVYILK
jgi:hypothetical protein